MRIDDILRECRDCIDKAGLSSVVRKAMRLGVGLEKPASVHYKVREVSTGYMYTGGNQGSFSNFSKGKAYHSKKRAQAIVNIEAKPRWNGESRQCEVVTFILLEVDAGSTVDEN